MGRSSRKFPKQTRRMRFSATRTQALPWGRSPQQAGSGDSTLQRW